MNATITINFDMDGTIANLYARPTWLEELRANDPTPYEVAEVMLNMSLLARYIHKAQRKGVRVKVISWLSKCPNAEYDQTVTKAKLRWLAKHLPSVEWDEIHIVPYGTPKSTFAKGYGILFDDEDTNREEWRENSEGVAFAPSWIMEILKGL